MKDKNLEENMDAKLLASLDGDATFQSITKNLDNVEAEKNRRNYRAAMRTQVIREKQLNEQVAKSQERLDKVSGKLNKLIEGGLEGYLTSAEGEEATLDDVFEIRKISTRKPTWRKSI